MQIERIISTSKADKSGFQVVLAKVEGFSPFVVWLRDAGHHYCNGWYNSNLAGAMQDYIERCNFNGVEA